MTTQLETFPDVNELLTCHVPSMSNFKDGAYKLDRMIKLMSMLGDPQNTYKTVHVAGTSGKTSTSYYIAVLLTASGKKVGLTVSPHIDEVNERVQINLRPMPETKFCHQFSKFMDKVDATGINPTYFELLVAFAFWQFAEDKVDYAVIEVGLGGLLDGTNVITCNDKVCVITDIGLDHTSVLGKTLSSIAEQKAGIIQKNNQVIMFRQTSEIMKVIKNKAQATNATLLALDTLLREPSELLPLYQQHNFELSYAVYKYLKERDDLQQLSGVELEAAAKTYIPARMEVVEHNGKTIIMDGAHNAQKMQALAGSLKAKYQGQEIATLLAVVKSEDFVARTDLAPILSLSNHIILTSFGGQQDLPKVSVEPSLVAEHCKEIGFTDLSVIADPVQAYQALLKRPEPILLITGSFYLMNHIRPLIRGKA